jgi:hypothetical protein
MIKTFKKTRQNLLLDGKTGKYLKYAIGEILLVVIGILIAVQINNWNQSRNRVETETTLLKQLKVEMLNIYSDIYSDYNLISLGDDSHYNIVDYIEKDVIYNDSMSFDFAFIKQDEYIYPSDAVYSRIKEVGLDIIRNDSIRFLVQVIYQGTFPRLSKNNSFNPDISETLDGYYLNHFRLNRDYSLKYTHTFDTDTLSGRTYRERNNYPYEGTRNGIKRKYTIGFVPLDFEALKKDHKFRLLLEQTKDYRNYKRRNYYWAKNGIQNLIRLIDKELEE